MEKIKVKVTPNDTKIPFDGEIIGETKKYYVVAPNYNPLLRQKWNKNVCELINQQLNNK
jgi:hypothetical protein